MTGERVFARCAAVVSVVLAGCVTSEREVSAGAPGVTGSALVSGASCDAANATGVASRYERALLDTIAYTEGTKGRGKDGYNVMFAYRYFDSCDEHPNTKVCSGAYCSTAAGRYQFLTKTYEGLKLDSFWPEAQERGALELIKRRGVSIPSGPMTATQFANALDRLSYEWASLPPARYGQTHFSQEQVRTEYCSLARCGELSSTQSSSPSRRATPANQSFITIERDGLMYRYQSDGSGRFTSHALTSGWDSVTAMGAGADYDEDGHSDLVTMDLQYGLELQFGDGKDDFAYLPLTLETGELIAIGAGADYDEDGHADFIATDDSGALVIARGNGRGQFKVEVLSRRGGDITTIGGGVDYNSDGHADFITLRNDGSALLYPGDGGGYFDVHPLDLDGTRLSLLGGGADYNSDGFGDLIATAADGSGYLYAGHGDGTFEARLLGAGWDWILFID